MRLVKGAEVYSAQGDRLGTLSRVIIDPNTREVTHIVIEKGLMFTTNKIIPIDRIDPQNPEKIMLNSSEQDLSQFDDFEEAHYVDLDTTEYPGSDVTNSFWYPPVDYVWWRSGMPAMTPPAARVYRQDHPEHPGRDRGPGGRRKSDQRRR